MSSSTGKSESRKHKKKGHKRDEHKSLSSGKHHKKDHKKDSHRHKKHKDGEKDRTKEHKYREKDSKSKHSSRSDMEPISEDDYFLKNEEFRVWLHVTKDTPFETLTTVQAREIFKEKFCKDWNRGNLASMYYDGNIPTELRQQCTKTAHKWGIKLSQTDKEQVSDLAYRVDSSTRKSFSNAWNHMAKNNPPVDSTKSIAPFTSGSCEDQSLTHELKRSRNRGDEQAEKEQRRQDEKSNRKRQRYHERERANVIMDEVAPKATGREAQLDKKLAAGARLKGAAADREAGRDGMELSEDVTMGGGDDFASVRARLLKGKQRKEEQKQDRLRELQDKERDKTDNFMKQLGIDFSKGPIKIQPR